MCGRYVIFTDQENKEIMEIIRQVNEKHHGIKLGEIYPTNVAPVILKDDVTAYKWGFPNFAKKGVIINARSETVEDKRMFKTAFHERRCVIPSTGFYEWQGKEKYHFTLPNSPIVYMAGIYTEFADENCFVILTTKANQSMEEIHDRMPLILEQDMIEDWINNDSAAMHILHHEPPALRHKLADQINMPLF
ncbi:SOS response-associated peptidase [Anaerosinus massiliensis]|uniref:SOS response-associated peptidase n=1 Tax=Massilibacillus massiliensis TaxID=1806837 RepID=UPI000DA6241B|nr:SOS response-associated peptidase [Massilibacillus massiliensis]